MHQRGDHIDIWVVDKQLGSGGMGSVYRCHNRSAPRILAAVKVLESSLRRSPEAEARFVREAEILHGLDHPHIVKVLNVRTDRDPPYLEMEFVAGESLEDWLVRGPVDYGLAVRLMLQMAQAVRYLHAQGIRHRDIKPANVLVQDGRHIKLVDFGLAVETDRTRITQHGMAFGTVSYAPPEWIHPETLDPARWDHYALGVVFFEMLTGRLAFPVSGQGSARQQAMQVIVGKQGHRPLDPGAAFPEPIREVIGALTRSDPAERLADLDELVRRLEGIVARAPAPAEHPIVDPRSVPEPPDHTVPSGSSGRTWTSSGLDTVEQRSGTGMLVAGLGALVGLALLGLGGAIAWGIVSSIQGSRDVEIVVEDGADVHLTLDDRLPADVDGDTWRFARIGAGEPVVLRWARGEGCRADACPGEGCAAWCGAGREAITVPPGEGAYRHTVELPVAAPRALAVAFPAYTDPDTALEATLDGSAGERRGTVVRFPDVAVGPHTLIARGGSCRDGEAPCWPDGDCRGRCVVHEAGIVVPWAEDVDPITVDMPEPERRGLRLPFGRSPAPEPVAPEPVVPEPPATTAAGLATTAAFAGWLADNPEWSASGDYGRAQGATYLDGWEGTTPPASRAPASAVTGVGYSAARAFCQPRGGLAPPDAPPHTWVESAGRPAFEWRENGFVPGARDSTGQWLTNNASTPLIMAGAGVRCAR